MPSSFFPDFQSYIAQQYPHFAEGARELSPFMVSSEIPRIPHVLHGELGEVIEILLATRTGEQTTIGCFDFYWTPEGLRLIEINTNAAAWVLVELLRGYHGIATPDFSPLCKAFRREWALQSPGTALTHVAIVDETPAQQKTHFEFLWIQAILRKEGIACEIFAPQDLHFDENRGALVDTQGIPWPFVYNRFCDFLLVTPEATDLRRAYEAGAVCLRPSPREYACLSDKTRLAQWSSPEWQASVGLSQIQREVLSRAIPPVEVMDPAQGERLWAQRKGLFFKPTASYGGKSVYSGKGITRTAFSRLLESRALAQPLFQPASWIAADGSSFKYDLRVYVIGDQIMSVAARLFQGQVNNFQTLGGGFAAVEFS